MKETIRLKAIIAANTSSSSEDASI